MMKSRVSRYLVVALNFTCLRVYAGNLVDFDIRVFREDNDLVITSENRLNAPEVSLIVNNVMIGKIGTFFYRTDPYYTSHFYPRITLQPTRVGERMVLIRVPVQGRRVSRYPNFFNAELILNSSMNAENWIAAFKEALDIVEDARDAEGASSNSFSSPPSNSLSEDL